MKAVFIFLDGDSPERQSESSTQSASAGRAPSDTNEHPTATSSNDAEASDSFQFQAQPFHLRVLQLLQLLFPYVYAAVEGLLLFVWAIASANDHAYFKAVNYRAILMLWFLSMHPDALIYLGYGEGDFNTLLLCTFYRDDWRVSLTVDGEIDINTVYVGIYGFFGWLID